MHLLAAPRVRPKLVGASPSLVAIGNKQKDSPHDGVAESFDIVAVPMSPVRISASLTTDMVENHDC